MGNMTLLKDFLAPKTLSELKEHLSQATNLVDATDIIDQVSFMKNKQKFVFENDAQWVKILTDTVNMSNNKHNLSIYLELSTDPVVSRKTGQRGTKKGLSFSPKEDSSDEEESDQVKNKRKRQKKRGKSSRSAALKKDERIDELTDKIRGGLSSQNLFTAPQIRLWTEMVDVGTHSSLSTPPKIPALGFKNTKEPTVTEKLTDSVSAMESSFGFLASVMSPQAAGSFISVTSSSVNFLRKIDIKKNGTKKSSRSF